MELNDSKIKDRSRETKLINYIPVPAGMPHSATLTGTKKDVLRTSQVPANTGHFGPCPAGIEHTIDSSIG